MIPNSPMFGIRIVTNEMIGDPYEDWSRVRSHGRAARRRKLGHPQRIVTRYRANGTMYHDKAQNIIFVHPHDYYRVQQALSAR